MKKSFTLLSMLSAAVLFMASCKKSDTAPTYTVPTTYNFSNANFADATTRLGMYTEMSNLMKTGTTTALNATTLKNMFSNTGSPFATAAYNTSGINIKGVDVDEAIAWKNGYFMFNNEKQERTGQGDIQYIIILPPS